MRPAAVLWVGQAISQLGDKLTNVALPILALRAAGGDMRVYALVLAAAVLPNILFGWAAGALVDWADRRRLMAGVEIGRGLCVAAMAAGPGIGPLLGLVFVNAVFALIFRPALTATVPVLVPAARITRMQALMEGTGRILDIFGFLAAGAVALTVGIAAALRLDAATFVVSALTVAALPLPRLRPQRRPSFSGEVRAGFAYHRENRLARDSLAFLAALALGIGAYNAMIVPAMTALLHEPLAFYGYWMAVQSAGGALGAYLVAVRPSWLPRRTLMLGSILAIGGLTAAIGANHSTPLALAMAGLFGVLNMAYNVTIVTWLQESVPGGLLGRVFALRQMGGGLFVTLGTLGAGAWAPTFGVGPLISLTGLYFAVVAAVGTAMPGLRPSAATARAAG